MPDVNASVVSDYISTLLGDANLNLTSLHDMVTQMFNRQTTMENKLEETERKLNETLEKLKIGNRSNLNAFEFAWQF